MANQFLRELVQDCNCDDSQKRFQIFIITRFKFIYTRNSIFMPESNIVQR